MFIDKEKIILVNNSNVNVGRKYMQSLIQQLQKYEKLDIQFQAVLGINVQQLLEIAKTCSVYVDINGEKYSLYTISDVIKKTGLSFYDIYQSIFIPKIDAKNNGESLLEILNRLSK